MKQKGFSLIELIVVVMIIGILSAIAVVGLTRQQQKARDTRRKTDIATINTTLQSYIADHLEPKMVPDYTSSDGGGWDYSSQLGGAAATDFISFLKTEGYTDSVPVDPINDGVGNVHFTGSGYAYGYYYYARAVDAGTEDINGYMVYKLDANLEVGTGGNVLNRPDLYRIVQPVRKR